MKNKKLLVVDDEYHVRRFVEASFRKAGVERFLFCDNGEEAVQLATREKPDLIVMDMKMPQMNGLAALRRLKQEANTCIIPVILISGDDFQLLSLPYGTVKVLNKPFTYWEIIDMARCLLGAS